jgi:hypothetical protein
MPAPSAEVSSASRNRESEVVACMPLVSATRMPSSLPLRIESVGEARAIDERIAAVWARHPRRFEIAPASEFVAKAAHAVEILRGELPECCRRHIPLPGK